MAESAIIFDLDGTLTRPMLNFDEIRREIGLPPGPILEALDGLDANERTRAESILARHEQIAAERSELYDGAATVLRDLRGRGCPTAILTRNARRWVDVVMDRHNLSVDAIRTRDDGAIKPSAQPVLSLCDELRCDPRDSYMIGDYLFDIQSGQQAGARTVLMIGDRPEPDFADLADHVIRRLDEVLGIVGNANLTDGE